MRRLGLALVVVTGILAGGGAAHAKVFEVYGQAQGGGGYGHGVAGAQMDNAFHRQSAGGMFGARLGAEVLFFDGWVEHQQFTDFADVPTGTWTQFMFGSDMDMPIGDEPLDKNQRRKTFFEVGAAIGYGVGTGQQVEPPLDASELSDRAFIGQVTLGVDYRFSKVASLGLTVPVTYVYGFKAAGDMAANDEETQYQSVSAVIFLHLRFRLELK